MVVWKWIGGEDIVIWNKKLNAFFNGSLSLDAHDGFYSFSDIKLGYVFAEFPSFDLSIIKKILDQMLHETGWWHLNIDTFI